MSDISKNGAPILTGRGIEAVRRHVAEQFGRVHGDLAQAFREIKPAQVEKSSITKTETKYGEQQERAFRIKSKYLAHAASRSTHIHSQRKLRRDQLRFEVEAPPESVAELFAQALRQLGGKST